MDLEARAACESPGPAPPVLAGFARFCYRLRVSNIDNRPAFAWDGPIIDIHAHPRGLHVGDDPGWEFIDELVSYAKSIGVVRMGSLGEVLFRASGFSEVEIRWLNDRNAELAARNSGFFFPFCFLDPTLGRDFVHAEVKRCYEVHGFRAIKLEIACNVAHPATSAVFETAAEYGFPVLVHATSTDVMGNREHQSDSADVRAALLAHPETKVLVAHLTAIGIRGVYDIEDLPNVCVDTSGMQPDSGIVEYAVTHLGHERVLFGSDAFYRDIPPQIGQVLGAGIDETTKRSLFYDNAARLFDLA